jgi:hypothetical protein
MDRLAESQCHTRALVQNSKTSIENMLSQLQELLLKERISLIEPLVSHDLCLPKAVYMKRLQISVR